MLTSGRKFKRVVQLELNEVSKANIQKLVARGSLPNFQVALRDWTFVATTSETTYEHIEPWIQWVTAHTGQEFSKHGIFRLGDAHELKHEQIWEVLSDHGIDSAIIGAMNATKGRMKGGVFFPDPWSKLNTAYPEELKGLWALISRRVQGHAASEPSLSDVRQALTACLKFRISPKVCARIGAQLLKQHLNPMQKWRLVALFDLFQAQLFLDILKSEKYGFCSLFLNSVAHYQHHFWRQFEREHFEPRIRCPDCGPNDDPVSYGYRIFDEILGLILGEVDLNETLVVIASGLSQVADTRHEQTGGLNYYRLKDHKAFGASLDIAAADIFPLMSRDWQVRVRTQEEGLRLIELLESLAVEGHQLLSCKLSIDGFVFIETALTGRVDDASPILLGDRTIGTFAKIFTNIAIKSGHHTGIGALWLSDSARLAPSVPKAVPLAQIFDLTKSALI